MALDKPSLKTALKNAFVANMPSPTTEQTNAFDALAGAMADAIDTFVKTGSVSSTVALGIPVSTTGTAAAQTGATTATGSATGSIS